MNILPKTTGLKGCVLNKSKSVMLLIKPSINGPELASADSSWKGVTADCPVKDSII